MGLESNNKSIPPSRREDDCPYWRREFPIDVSEDTRRTRRSFLGGVTVAGSAMACGQVALNRVSEDGTQVPTEAAPTSVTLPKKLHEIAVGEALPFHFPDERTPCLLVRLTEHDCVAYAQKCTHLACPVIPDIAQQELHCPCHHGAFDLQTGVPIAGPPREPLPRIQVDVEPDGSLIATQTT